MNTNRILFYSFIATSLFILQSCVSNYAIAVPQINSNVEEIDKIKIAKSNALKMKHVDIDEVIESVVVKSDNKAILANIEKEVKKSNTIDEILNEAHTYIGTPYRYGGNSRRGIDCSAFVLSVFDSAAGINLPRVSAQQAKEGEKIEKSEIEKGDLLFFQTRGKRISHVGIVQDITPEGEIKFIHASSSKGVTISSLNERYWNARYRFAKRVLTDFEDTL